MNFRDQATREASALVDQLRAEATEQVLHEVQTLRSALDAAVGALERTVGSSRDNPAEASLTTLVERLTEAATEQTRVRLEQQATQAEASLQAVRAELQQRERHNEELMARLQQLQADCEALQADLRKASNLVDATIAERMRATEALAHSESVRAELEAAWQQETRARTALEQQLATARQRPHAPAESIVLADDPRRAPAQATSPAAPQVGIAELREYAAMLVHEIEHIYVADVAAGSSELDLRDRLRDNIGCARQIYAQRVALEGPLAAPLLDEQLAASSTAGTSFARELARILGAESTHDLMPARAVAEAS